MTLGSARAQDGVQGGTERIRSLNRRHVQCGEGWSGPDGRLGSGRHAASSAVLHHWKGRARGGKEAGCMPATQAAALDRRDAEVRAAWTKDASAAMQMNGMCRRRPGSTSCPSRPQGHGPACLRPSQPHYALKMLLPCARASLHQIDGLRFA
jgi:hypothetical protein